MSIFISIASFCDRVLPFTLKQAVSKAKWPEQLHFGVIDQSAGEPLKHDVGPAKLTVIHIDPVESRGCCWARALAMSLYEDEDWFFQIDSHMDFLQDWDETLILEAQKLSVNKKGIVISSYPNGFSFVDDKPVHKVVAHSVLVQVVKPNTTFNNNSSLLTFEGHPFTSEESINGFHIAAGCLFGQGKMVKEIPYDPYLYFHGEEQSFAARLYTHGWDIYHMPKLPIFHLYNDDPRLLIKRPLHWDNLIDKNRKTSFSVLQKKSNDRVKALLTGTLNLDNYGLGNVRTMREYAEFSGIDYKAQTLSERAYKGHWKIG